MTPLEILKGARKIISDPTHWTQGTWARNKEGVPVNELAKEAFSFCALGALTKAVRRQSFGSEVRARARDALAHNTPHFSVSDVNDHGTHADVLKLFDTTISKMEAEQK